MPRQASSISRCFLRWLRKMSSMEKELEKELDIINEKIEELKLETMPDQSMTATMPYFRYTQEAEALMLRTGQRCC